MKYLSLCSGIEAATVAWHPLGWNAFAYSEIEPFPSAVLAHHYPNTPNFGDMTKFQEWPHAAIDLLVGGTPCQSFSVAGLRKGLADPRGNLMLTYLAIADNYRPQWLVWENVPGVLSSNKGRDFGTFLAGLGQLGYGFAYRVLDAQYFGVAQRRRRVFVVGCLGNWRAAAAVLFERESLSGNPAPRREAREGVAGTLEASLGRSRGAGTPPGALAFGGGNTSGALDVAACLVAKGQKCDFEVETFISHPLRAQSQSAHDESKETYVTHALRGEGFDASEDGTGRGTPLVPVEFIGSREIAGTVTSNYGKQPDSSDSALGPNLAIAFDCKASGQSGFGVGDIASTMRAMGHSNSHTNGGGHQAVMTGMQVRRLTPRECERLQGFPDDYTLINVRGKPAADGPRYKALGNSMAVPVMHWIGKRIQLVANELHREKAA